MRRLTPGERWRERRFVIVSMIRLLSEVPLSIRSLYACKECAMHLREVVSDGGNLSDDKIWECYSRKSKLNGSEEYDDN